MGLYANFSPGEVAAAGVVFLVIGAMLVATRIGIRRGKKKNLGPEDWLVFPALALTTGMGIATTVGVARRVEGYKIPSEKGPYQDYTERTMEQIFWNTEWMQPLALGCIKMSFIFFYRRIFSVGTNTKIFNFASIASLVIMAVWMLGFFLAVMLICPGHVGKYWTPPSIRAEYCWTTTKFLYALCWSDVATDLIVILLPIPSILRLHMTPRKKIAVFAIFSLGALTLAASIIRAVFYVQLLNAEKAVTATFDPNMLNTNGIYWMLVETGLALIAVNLPLLYGSVRHEGVESVIRKVRSFTSIRSIGSHGSKSSSKASSMRKDSDESHEVREKTDVV
ncbi:MAG: hypothetical protein Q9169_006530 [Polycauliona sp. 2 TL-2023]